MRSVGLAALIGIAATTGLMIAAGAGAQVARPGQGLSAGQLRANDANGVADRLNQRGLVRPDITTPDGTRIYSRMLVVGRCMAGLGRKASAGVLDKPMNSAAERQEMVIVQARLQSCQAAGTPDILTLVRGALSEGLYHRIVDKGPATLVAPMEAEQINSWSAAQTPRLSTLLPADRGLSLVIDCLVIRQPQVARRVLDATHGSEAEQQALNALFAGSPQCLPSGPRPPISRSFLRAFVASAAYRAAQWQEQRAA